MSPAPEEAEPCKPPAVVGGWQAVDGIRWASFCLLCPLHVGLGGGTALEWDEPDPTSELRDHGQGSEPRSLGFLTCETRRKLTASLTGVGTFSQTMYVWCQLKGSDGSLLSPMTVTWTKSSREWPLDTLQLRGPGVSLRVLGDTLGIWQACPLGHGGSPALQEAISAAIRGPVVSTVDASHADHLLPGQPEGNSLEPSPHHLACSLTGVPAEGSSCSTPPSSGPRPWLRHCLPPRPGPSPAHSPLPT